MASMWRPLMALITVLMTMLMSEVAANRVYELSDKFVEAYKRDTKMWLVKFYAPWCHHCKQMEPTYMQVAQMIHNEDIGVYVGRLDCTRFSAAAQHFDVHGFPTIKFVSPQKVVEYFGDRAKDELVDFTRRMAGPQIRPVHNCADLNHLLNTHKMYFVYFGPSVPGQIVETIEDFHAMNWFYHSKMICPGFDEGLYAIKGATSEKITIKLDNDTHSVAVADWIRQHRFPQFVKINHANFRHLLNSGKILIVAVVEEYHSVGRLINSRHEEFREMVEAIANKYTDRERFVFGWCSHVDLLNSIALQAISKMPTLLVINSPDLKYHILDDALPQTVIELLDQLIAGTAPLSGGNTFFHRILRWVYDSIAQVISMYRGNPILTLLLFGLPMAFFAIIVYTTCCTDILDAREEEEDEPEEDHEHQD